MPILIELNGIRAFTARSRHKNTRWTKPLRLGAL